MTIMNVVKGKGNIAYIIKNDIPNQVLTPVIGWFFSLISLSAYPFETGV